MKRQTNMFAIGGLVGLLVCGGMAVGAFIEHQQTSDCIVFPTTVSALPHGIIFDQHAPSTWDVCAQLPIGVRCVPLQRVRELIAERAR